MLTFVFKILKYYFFCLKEIRADSNIDKLIFAGTDGDVASGTLPGAKPLKPPGELNNM